MVKVECHGCQSPYEIEERRIPPAGLKMRCPKCGTSILVTRDGASATPGPAGPPPAGPPPAAPPRPRPAPPRPTTTAAPSSSDFGVIDSTDFGVIDPLADESPPSSITGGVDLPSTLEMSTVSRGAVDLPSPVVRKPPAPPPPRAAGGAPKGAGFGEIDLMVDFPGSEEGMTLERSQPSTATYDAGAIDLPTARGPVGGASAPNDDFGAIDLPSLQQSPQRAKPPPPPPRPGFGEVGLPAPAGVTGLPLVGGANLPAPAGNAAGQPGLPAPFGRQDAGLPALGSQASGQPGLPSPFGGAPSAGLPAPAHSGLPMPSHAGLPASAQAGLPVTSQAGLPLTSAAGYPMAAAGGLPSPASAGYPMNATSGLPVTSAAGYPTPASAGYPSAASAGYPSASSSGLPIVGGHLPEYQHASPPSVAGGGLPVIGGSLPASLDPSFDPMAGVNTNAGPSTIELNTSIVPHASQPPSPLGAGEMDLLGSGGGGTGAEFQMGGSQPPPGVGGEFDIGGDLPGKDALPRPQRKKDDRADEDRPPSRVGRYILAGIGVMAIAGAALTWVPSVGFFGMNFISDTLNGGKQETALGDLRKKSVVALDTDTHKALIGVIDAAKRMQSGAPRHRDTAAYAGFLMYMKSIRFGKDANAETQAKNLVDKLDRKKPSDMLALLAGAEYALAGQIEKAKREAQTVLAKTPGDVDALMLVGEAELIGMGSGGSADVPAAGNEKAIEPFSKAVTTHKSARTLFGLSRAQFVAGKLSEAEATAKSVLELSENHAGARIMLAVIAAETKTRTAEAITALQKVVADGGIRAEAGPHELVQAYATIGRLQVSEGHMSQAEEAFGEALKLDPQDVASLVGSGELFYRAGRNTEAEARFESATRVDANNIDAKVGRAKTWLALERAKEARDLLKPVVDQNPKNTAAQYWLGRLEETIGNKKEAEVAFKAAIENATKAEQGIPAYTALSHLLASLDRHDEAKKQLVEAAQKYPDTAELSRARGDIALAGGRFEEARQNYEDALKKQADLGTRFSLGITLRRMRHYDEAAAVFDQVAAVDKNYPGLSLERGLYFEETGQTEQALAMYAEALKKAPDDIDLKLRIGSTQVIAGHPQQAEPILREVVKARPNSAEANHFLGRALLLMGANVQDAQRFLQKAVEQDDKRAEYHLYVGWSANDARQPQKAEQALKRAIELDSTLGDAYWQLGVLLLSQGATRDAIDALAKALERKPSRYEAYATLALCYEDQSEWSRAEEAWKRAIGGNDKVAEWHYRLGKAYERRNATGEVIKELERALDLVQSRDTPPGWIYDAHRLLGEAFEGSDREKAKFHYTEFVKLSPQDNVYRKEVEAKLEQMKR